MTSSVAATETPAAAPEEIRVSLEAPAPEAPAPAPAVRHYRHVDLAAALAPDRFLPLERTGGLYVARLHEPLLVQTPPLALASPLDDEDGTPLPHAHLTLPRGFQAFVQQAEDLVLQACLANKSEWFRRPLEDDSIRASFKPFYKPGGTLKIKVPRDSLVFGADGQLLCREDVGVGSSMRCLLELSRVCLGRTEFGAMWSLVQAQTAPPPPPPPRCMIDPAADAEDAPCGPVHEADSEVHEFL